MIRLDYSADEWPVLGSGDEKTMQRRFISHESRKGSALGSCLTGRLGWAAVAEQGHDTSTLHSGDLCEAWPRGLCDLVLNRDKAHLRLNVLGWAKPSAPQISAEPK